jgi:hypothetical protein
MTTPSIVHGLSSRSKNLRAGLPDFFVLDDAEYAADPLFFAVTN